MGSGNWNDSLYMAQASARAARGEDDFAYSASQAFIPRHQRKAADVLDPYGVTLREARDSAEHPNSTPIVVLFDVTGSMRAVPRTLQRKLSELLGLLTRGGYCDDPQIMVGAIGDDVFDRVPLQIGQFESDNRIDEQLRQIYLEGGGGGDKREGYALAAHFLDTRVQADAIDRGRKGYVFFIGDEMNKTRLEASSVQQWLGEAEGVTRELEELYASLRANWNVFYVLPNLTAYYTDAEIEAHWRGLVGERFLRLEDPSAVAELIATTIGLTEDAIDLVEGVAAAGAAGSAVGNALANLGDPNERDRAGRGGLLPAGA